MAEETPAPTDQDNAVAEELVRLRGLSQKFAPLEGIADALDEDPSKIFAIRAALEGRAPAAAPVVQPAQQQLTPDQIQALRNKFDENPLETSAAIGQAAAAAEIAKFFNDAKPYIEATTDNFVELFKNRKAAADKLFKQIEPLFNKELQDVNKGTLLSLPVAERARMLELRWDSASAKVFRKAMESAAAATPPNLGGGSGSSGTAKPKSIFEKDMGVAALAAKLGLTEDEMKAIDTEIKNGDALEYDD